MLPPIKRTDKLLKPISIRKRERLQVRNDFNMSLEGEKIENQTEMDKELKVLQLHHEIAKIFPHDKKEMDVIKKNDELL